MIGVRSAPGDAEVAQSSRACTTLRRLWGGAVRLLYPISSPLTRGTSLSSSLFHQTLLTDRSNDPWFIFSAARGPASCAEEEEEVTVMGHLSRSPSKRMHRLWMGRRGNGPDCDVFPPGPDYDVSPPGPDCEVSTDLDLTVSCLQNSPGPDYDLSPSEPDYDVSPPGPDCDVSPPELHYDVSPEFTCSTLT
ncbi:hypothetical protein WMY93_028452 [Mugilogobius chulae]|uniref:Uncharacterized protein n=1 Tax=Mugilogobius chulae TaxID=88201 RepID=A0AAW0MNG7_9GOBI